jgi:hypothetical protein
MRCFTIYNLGNFFKIENEKQEDYKWKYRYDILRSFRYQKVEDFISESLIDIVRARNILNANGEPSEYTVYQSYIKNDCENIIEWTDFYEKFKSEEDWMCYSIKHNIIKKNNFFGDTVYDDVYSPSEWIKGDIYGILESRKDHFLIFTFDNKNYYHKPILRELCLLASNNRFANAPYNLDINLLKEEEEGV